MIRALLTKLRDVLQPPRPTGDRGGTPNFVFAIPVAAHVNDQQWANLNDLLGQTLRSLLNEADPRFLVIIAGHDRPQCLDSVPDPRVRFLKVTFPKPATAKQKRRDKRNKRWAIATELRRLGGGYFMYMDADDFIHRDLVGYVLRDDNRTGYFIPEGYALDYKNDVLAPIPGAWRKPFNHVCGSSGIIYFEREDLPRKPFPRQLLRRDRYFRIRNHRSFETVTLRDRPNAPIPFRAALYSVNNGLNLSNDIVRTEERQQSLIAGIKKREIVDSGQIRDEFGMRRRQDQIA